MRRLSLLCVFLATVSIVLAVRFTATQGGSFITAPDVAWASPTAIALNNVGPADPIHNERSYDCASLMYRMIDDPFKTMRRGCFVPTAFGMIDPDKSLVLFNGSDEAEYIKQGSQPAALSIMPHSGSVARFGGFPGQGAYMYLYSNFYGTLRTEGNILVGRHKSITQNANFTVSGSDGQPLAVNPQALAYSARSQWLVTEVPGNALVRINLATFAVTPFAPSLDSPGRPFATHSAAMAISEDGRYAAVASGEYKTLRIYDLKNCGAATSEGPLRPQNCQSHDYWPFLQAQIAGTLQGISHINFVGDDLLSFDLVSSGGREQYLLSPDGPIESLIPYLGLGDSYASGQGAFNYTTASDTTNNKCHLSVHSYPLRLNQSKFGNRGQSVACSGARSRDVGNKSAAYTGQTSDQIPARDREADGSEVTILTDFKPGYLAQERFVTAYRPGVITLQIGGNDVGFGAMLQRCLSPLTGIKPVTVNVNSCYQTYEDRLELVENINRNYGGWVALYKQLQQQSPVSRIYVIGYPHIVSAKADCRANVHLTLAELHFAREVTLYLNSVIKRATEAAGVTYIDIADALAGHELCSGASGILAVNGLTAGNDAYGLGQESFHPTAYGHELIERAILQKTRNFAFVAKPLIATVDNPTAVPATPLLQAPRTGRQIHKTQYDTFTSGRALHDSSINIRLNGTDAGMSPNTSYSIGIGNSKIGNITSDNNGSLSGVVTIPTTIPPGLQIIDIIGPGYGGEPIKVGQPIYVPVSPIDADGDGIKDDIDSCPLITNSGQDNNLNGTDDACDNNSPTPPNFSNPDLIIAPPPAAPSSELQNESGGSNGSIQATTSFASLLQRSSGIGGVLIASSKLPTNRVSTSSVVVAPISKRAVLGAHITKSLPEVTPRLGGLPVFYWYLWLILILAVYIGWKCACLAFTKYVTK